MESVLTPAGAPSAAADFVSVLPAALSAARCGLPFVIGWLSRGGGAALELATNAGPLATSGEGPQVLLYPAGARGVRADEQWARTLADMVWMPCPGRQAPALDPEQIPAARSRGFDEVHRPSLFETTLVTLMASRFAWLMVAEPTDRLAAEVAESQAVLNALRLFEESSERSRFDVERTEHRLGELDSYREAGLWEVRVLVGADREEQLAQIAPVLVGSVDLTRHPYRIRSGDRMCPLSAAVTVHDGAGEGSRAADEGCVPFPATAGVLGALAGLPHREVPGLRVVDPGHFDVTSETGIGSGSVELGSILDPQDRPVGPFSVPMSTLNRHTFVTGATGAGKSQTVRHLLEQLSRAGLPWLAIEPAKSEYAAMAGRLADLGTPVTVVNPIDPHAIPVSVNPLEPEPGYPVQAHIDMVRALFQAAFDANDPFPQIMSQALQRVYEEAGWDVVTGGAVPGASVPPSVPTLRDLQDGALQVIGDVGYGREVSENVRGFVSVRLGSLRVGAAGRFFEGGHPVDIEKLLAANVVLAIEDVANDEDKAFLMGTLIIRIVEHLRLRSRRERATGLEHVIVIEEAHRLLRDRGGVGERASAHAVELFAGMLAEIRAYGEGIIIAEQIPTKLVPDAVKNTALKIVHRLPAADDRELVGAAMNIDDDQSRKVVSMPPGVAAVFADGMDRPLRVGVPYGEGREAVADGPAPPNRGRRSPACGPACRARACTLYELREADLAAGSGNHAWTRIWVDALVLAHITGNPLPNPPKQLHTERHRVPGRRLECLLATAIERAIGPRATALRCGYEPERLTGAVAVAAAALLDRPVRGRGSVAGAEWVPVHLRWVVEYERVEPMAGRPPYGAAIAPSPRYELADPGGVIGRTVSMRKRALARHPASMWRPDNREIARRMLLGRDDHAAVVADLEAALPWVEAEHRLAEAGRRMAIGGWYGSVLAWPEWLTRFARSP